MIGTLFPAALLIGLGVYWLVAGRHNAIPFHASKLVPNLGSVNNVVFFAGVLLGFAGVEMAGYHAKETRNMRRDYPRAVFLSTGLILVVSILATLAIAFVVPQAQAQPRVGPDAGLPGLLRAARARRLGHEGHGGPRRVSAPWR